MPALDKVVAGPERPLAPQGVLATAPVRAPHLPYAYARLLIYGFFPDYVNSNPSAFENAYWDFAAARVYLPSSSASNSSNATSTSNFSAASSSSTSSGSYVTQALSVPVLLSMLIGAVYIMN